MADWKISTISGVHPCTWPSDSRTMRAPGGVVSVHICTKNVGSMSGRASGADGDFVAVGSGGRTDFLRRHPTVGHAIAAKAKAPKSTVQNLRRRLAVVPSINADCIAPSADVQRPFHLPAKMAGTGRTTATDPSAPCSPWTSWSPADLFSGSVPARPSIRRLKAPIPRA